MMPTVLLFGVIAAAQQFYQPQAPIQAQQQVFLAPGQMVQRPLPFRAAAEKKAMLSTMGEPIQVVDQFTNSIAGVVAVDGGTVGLDVSFAAFLAVILGLFIPVVFLVTLYIQSMGQGTDSNFRMPDKAPGVNGELFEEM